MRFPMGGCTLGTTSKDGAEEECVIRFTIKIS